LTGFFFTGLVLVAQGQLNPKIMIRLLPPANENHFFSQKTLEAATAGKRL